MSRIETILNQVERVGKAREDFCAKVAEFAEQIIKTGNIDLGKYEVITCRSNVGTGDFLVKKDDESQNAIDQARATGGGYYMHRDFNCWINRADYNDCVEFIDYINSAYGKTADEALAAIEEKMKFFAEKN